MAWLDKITSYGKKVRRIEETETFGLTGVSEQCICFIVASETCLIWEWNLIYTWPFYFLHVTYGLYMVIGWNQIQRKTAEAVGDFRKTPIYIVGIILKNNLPLWTLLENLNPTRSWYLSGLIGSFLHRHGLHCKAQHLQAPSQHHHISLPV
jgi:hypothetical protein